MSKKNSFLFEGGLDHQEAIEAYRRQFAMLTEEQKKLLEELVPVRTYKKGTILLKEGQIANESYYTIKGCLRKYYLIDGVEKTTGFFTEGHSITSYLSSSRKMPSKHYISCLENTTVTVFTRENETTMYERFPQFESLCRVGVEEELGEYQEKLARFITSSPEERYLNILKNRPELIGRVPQYHLASYLGMKPESLSRIRKRIMK